MASEAADNVPAIRSRPEVVNFQPMLDTDRFEHFQRACKALMNSTLLPESVRGNSPEQCFSNLMLVHDLSDRWKLPALSIAQCIAIVHGKVVYEGKLVAAMLDATLGLRLDYHWTGERGTPSYRVYVSDRPWADLVATDWPKTLQPAAEEDPLGPLAPGVYPKGWRVIDGSVEEWRTFQKDQRTVNPAWTGAASRNQLAYRGSREWARLYEPAQLLGVYGDDEADAWRDQWERTGRVEAQATVVDEARSGGLATGFTRPAATVVDAEFTPASDPATGRLDAQRAADQVARVAETAERQEAARTAAAAKAPGGRTKAPPPPGAATLAVGEAVRPNRTCEGCGAGEGEVHDARCPIAMTLAERANEKAAPDAATAVQDVLDGAVEGPAPVYEESRLSPGLAQAGLDEAMGGPLAQDDAVLADRTAAIATAEAGLDQLVEETRALAAEHDASLLEATMAGDHQGLAADAYEDGHAVGLRGLTGAVPRAWSEYEGPWMEGWHSGAAERAQDAKDEEDGEDEEFAGDGGEADDPAQAAFDAFTVGLKALKSWGEVRLALGALAKTDAWKAELTAGGARIRHARVGAWCRALELQEEVDTLTDLQAFRAWLEWCDSPEAIQERWQEMVQTPLHQGHPAETQARLEAVVRQRLTVLTP